MNEIQEKIARLPTWARECIRKLEEQAAPNNNELRRMSYQVAIAEKRCRAIQVQMDAMIDIFKAAGRGGSETAQAYVDRIVNEYTSTKED